MYYYSECETEFNILTIDIWKLKSLSALTWFGKGRVVYTSRESMYPVIPIYNFCIKYLLNSNCAPLDRQLDRYFKFNTKLGRLFPPRAARFPPTKLATHHAPQKPPPLPSYIREIFWSTQKNTNQRKQINFYCGCKTFHGYYLNSKLNKLHSV